MPRQLQCQTYQGASRGFRKENRVIQPAVRHFKFPASAPWKTGESSLSLSLSLSLSSGEGAGTREKGEQGAFAWVIWEVK